MQTIPYLSLRRRPTGFPLLDELSATLVCQGRLNSQIRTAEAAILELVTECIGIDLQRAGINPSASNIVINFPIRHNETSAQYSGGTFDLYFGVRFNSDTSCDVVVMEYSCLPFSQQFAILVGYRKWYQLQEV